MTLRAPGMVLLLFGITLAGPGYSQESVSVQPQTPDSDTYLLFLRQVVNLPSPGGDIRLNGRRFVPRHRTLEEAIGLTEREARTVHSSAAHCITALESLDESGRGVVFEARLEAINLYSDSRAWRDRLEQLNRARHQLIAEHVEQIKRALGPIRFSLIDVFIASASNPRAFFESADGP